MWCCQELFSNRGDSFLGVWRPVANCFRMFSLTLYRLIFFRRFSGHIDPMIGSFRLPTYNRDAHWKLF